MANDLSNFTPEIWSKMLVARINQVNVMLPLANRKYEGEITQAGSKVWVRTFGDVAVQPYSKNAPIVYTDLPSTKEELDINLSQMFAIKVDDIDTVQNDINALTGYTDRAGVSMSNTIEATLQGQYGSVNPANVVNNGGSAITISASNAYTTLVSAGLALDNFSVPTFGRWALVSPTFKSFLVKDTTYVIRATDMGDNVVISGMLPDGEGGFRQQTVGDARNRGYIGQAAGFDLFLSTACPTDASGRYCMFGQGQPISYAAQLNEIEALRLQTTFASAVRGLLLHGVKIFAEDAKRIGYMQIGATQ